MSAEGEAIRSNDYRKDTTVKAPSTRPAAVLGLDVGKSSHWACLIDRDGEVLDSAPVRNREAELDALFASAPAGTLVVVDQFRNIGSLAVRRARAAGLGVAHLPGLAASRAYACLLTVPGIGPRTAAQLAVSVDIGRFPDHDHLASYCGIAPRVRSSGTSVRSVRASRRGDARLKSLLIFSCNSLVRSSGRYGEYYRACRARGMGHGRALKAVARKRLRAIYAVMRDRVPYRE